MYCYEKGMQEVGSNTGFGNRLRTTFRDLSYPNRNTLRSGCRIRVASFFSPPQQHKWNGRFSHSEIIMQFFAAR